MYSLSYEMIVQVLRQFGYSGEVHAEISIGSALKKSGHVVLVAQYGEIRKCIILQQDGQRLAEDEQAYAMLSRLGVLDWQLVPASPPGMAQSPSPSFTGGPGARSGSFCPRRLPLSPSQMQSWPMLYRSVYALADGTRSIEHIAMLLSHPLLRIEQIVRNLQDIGGISRSE
jgi:hypothetical protein